MYQNDPMKVLTGKCRLSYCHLTEPRATMPGAEPKYSVSLLIPKSDVETKRQIDAAIQAATQDGVSRVWNNARPPQMRVPIYDGDGLRPSGEAFDEICHGHWVLSASSKQRPEVVDLSLSPILNASDIYSGMYARVTIRFFAYASNGNKGIGCGLGNVLKVEDGEPLGGRTSAASDFSGVVQPGMPAPPYSPGAPAYAPVQPAQAPTYIQPAAPMYPVQPAQAPAPAYTQPVAIDPITGQPAGAIFGL